MTEISVTGTGTASGAPDLATISMGVTVLGASVADATAKAGDAAARVIAAIGNAGIDDSDVQTADYSVHPEQDHRQQPPRVVGYRVSNTVSVVVRNLDTLSEVLDSVTAAGGDATTMHGLRFGRADTAQDRETARALAWEDAVAVAGQLAALAGVRLGSPLSIHEGGGAGAPLRRARSMSAESGPPIEPGSVSQTVQLAVTFATQPPD